MSIKLNASAMTFCSPFCLRDLLTSKKRLSTNLRTKLVWRPFDGFLSSFWRTKKLHDLLPSLFSFGRQKVTKRTTKSRTIFLVSPIWSATKKRQQKVAEVILDGKKSPWGKGRQKVAALVFTCSNKMFTCTLHIVIALKSKHLHFLHLDVWAPPLNSRLAFLSEMQTLCFSPLQVFCSCASSPDPSMFLGLGQSHPLSTVHQEHLLSLESQGQGKPVVDRV